MPPPAAAEQTPPGYKPTQWVQRIAGWFVDALGGLFSLLRVFF